MKLHLACGLSALVFALTACDTTDLGRDDASELQFRSEGGDVGNFQVRTQTTSFKIKGCDPPFPDWLRLPASEAPREWQEMAYTQARMMADETLVASFLAARDVEEFCGVGCDELGGRWNGGAELLDAEHDFGEVEVVGECPNETIATSIPATSRGDVACSCEF